MISLASLILITWGFILIPTLVNGLGSSSSSTLAVVYGTATVCGIVAGEPTQRVRCYQSINNNDRTISVLPNISFQEISGGRSFFCGLRRGGLNLLCWDGASFRPKRIYHSDTVALTDLTVGDDQVCAREAATGFARCWRGGGGEPPHGHDDLEPFRGLGFSKIACGSGFVCGILRNNNSVFCWGRNKNSTGDYYYYYEIFRAQSGFGNLSMSSLVAGESHACGLTVSGGLICKGSNDSGQLNVPSNGSNFEFSGLALGANFTCAIRRANGSVICWGGDFDTDGVTVIGTVSFESIVAGLDFVCGLSRKDLSVFCWGRGWPSSRSNSSVPIGPLVRSSHSEILRQGEFPLAVVPLLSPTSSHKHAPKLLLVFLIIALVVFTLSFCGLLWRLRSSAARPDAVPYQNPEKFSLSELAAATGDFSSGNRIGFGSFGAVYRGKLPDGQEVAVKRGHSRTKKSLREKEAAFESELAALSRLRHKHLVSLVGFCRENDERLLVYDYMPNGSLHRHLHSGSGENDSAVLGSRKVRIRIALEAARGIEYLHDRADPPVIHRDIKSSNILLDSGMAAKLSDFGLSAAGRAVSGAAAGTVGYIDPEFYASNVSTAKSDVYGLGVVMLELLTGKRAVFRSDGAGVVTSVVEFAEKGLVLDERAAEGGPAVEILAATALRCVSAVGVWRPTVAEVVASLETAFALCQ